MAHYNLGGVLESKGEIDPAIVAYREAIRLKPDFAEAHCNLGLILQNQARYSTGLALLKRGHELGSRNAGWKYPSARWVDTCARFADLEARLSALLKGEVQPLDPSEGVDLANIAYQKSLYAVSAIIYDRAFSGLPSLANDLKAAYRYNAACSAALAGSAAGLDEPRPDDQARTKFREQTLSWLRADLKAWEKTTEGGEASARATLVKKLDHWKKDTDLAGIRDEAGLAKLSEAEQASFRSFWADVEALRIKAGGGK